MAAKFKDVIKPILVPIHPEGWGFVAIFFIVTVILGIFWHFLFYIGMIFTVWCIYFFRDPKRVTPTQAGLVISPADGVVQSIKKAVPPIELDMGSQSLTRIAIFMNVFDVHVNRMPVSGKITKMAYRKGKFLNADLDKASDDNERQSYLIEMTQDQNKEEDSSNVDKTSTMKAIAPKIAMVQIAGLVARRILTEVNEGDALHVGNRVGMIRFGSRVDVYVPNDISIFACVGQRAVAGETVIAEFSELSKADQKLGRESVRG